MKWNVYLGTLVLTLGLSTQSFGFDLLDRMLGVSSGCCDSGCCEATCGAAACGCDNGCAAGPACGCDNGCDACAEPACGCADTSCCCSHRHGRHLLDRLFGCHRGCGCASACEPACGCEAAACGCDNGCDACAEPACGCAETACCGSHRHCGGLLGHLFRCRKSCGCASACEPACGCESACDNGCAAPACGAPVVSPAAPVVQPAPAQESAAVDPSAKRTPKLRVRNASHVIRYGR
jgi:hypothetical protein